MDEGQEGSGPVRHITVGEGAPFGFNACRGAYDLARQDAERSEWLAPRAKATAGEVIEGMCACGDDLAPGNTCGQCDRCRKREWMRQARKAKPGPEPKVREPLTCPLCRAVFPWSRGRHLCAQCQAKPWRWRQAQYRLRGITPPGVRP